MAKRGVSPSTRGLPCFVSQSGCSSGQLHVWLGTCRFIAVSRYPPMRCEPRVFLMVIPSAPHEAPVWLQHSCISAYRAHCVCPVHTYVILEVCVPCRNCTLHHSCSNSFIIVGLPVRVVAMHTYRVRCAGFSRMAYARTTVLCGPRAAVHAPYDGM